MNFKPIAHSAKKDFKPKPPALGPRPNPNQVPLSSKTLLVPKGLKLKS